MTTYIYIYVRGTSMCNMIAAAPACVDLNALDGLKMLGGKNIQNNPIIQTFNGFNILSTLAAKHI